jgi:sugar phosphate isomerase/epimerase
LGRSHGGRVTLYNFVAHPAQSCREPHHFATVSAMTRREFVPLSAGAAAILRAPIPGLAGQTASAPVPAEQKAPFPLGFNTYCLRALRWNDAQLLKYAAEQKLDAIFLQDSLDPAAMEPAHWKEVRELAQRLYLRLETGGGALWNAEPEKNFAQTVATLRKQIQRAHDMGSAIVRCLIAGNRAALPKGPVDAVIDYVLRIIKEVRSQLQSSGLRLAFEVHKDLQAWEYRRLIEAAGPLLVGTYLDTGNPVFVMEDPMTTLEELGKYALTVHLRDSVVYETKKGIAVQWVPLGEGIIDFKAYLRRLGEIVSVSKNDVCVYVKPIGGRPPETLPVFDREWWENFPNARATDLAKFLALAKKGEPYDKPMVVEDLAGVKTPPYYEAALQHQQQEHVERSIEYARTQLNLGRRWRGMR